MSKSNANNISTSKFTPVGDGNVHARYENIGNSHVVYLEVACKVRRVIFPTQSMALNFMQSNLKVYGKLRDHM